MENETTATIEKEEIERIFLGFVVEAEKQMRADLHIPRKKVIVISGPTATGKTEFAIQLAKELHGEIVSADSMQVFRGMDLGTAKPSREMREAVPHHLIDTKGLTEAFNVVDFYYEARQCCQEIHDRGAVPIVVGGSGFYLHSFIYGPPSGPASVPELRKALAFEMEQLGADALFERLRKLDPQYAATITKNDKQKIIRALEIIELSGQAVSKHSWKGRKKAQSFDFLCWFLFRPKEKLYPRIETRCDKMLAEGFLDEVKSLKGAGLLENASASQAIGYKQALEFLSSPQTAEDYQEFVKAFKAASRKYAKRQMTWFRKEPLFRWLDLDMHDPEIAREIVRRDFEQRL